MTEQTWGQTAPGAAPGGQQQATASAPFSADEFFAKAGGGGVVAPSFNFDGIGSGLLGTIHSREVMAKTKPGKPGQAAIPHLDKNGQQLYQLRVVIQTGLRNWNGVKKAPTTQADANGNTTPLPPSDDTGLRSIYLWYTLRDAVGAAVAAKGQRELVDGATLGVKVVGLNPNPYGGQDIKEYTAVYFLPGDPSAPPITPIGGPEPAAQQQAPVQQAPVQQAPVQQAPVQQAPVQQAPVQQAPVQQAPVQQAPVQQAQDPWAAAPADLGSDAPPF